MKKAQKKPVDANAWMNTYADMVTLLLCFFVMLFAASSLDSEKWQILVRSLNPKAMEQSQIASDEPDGDQSNTMGTTGSALVTDVETFDQLYWSLQQYIEQNNLSADVDVIKGDGYTFIVFRNNVFFDGDQYYLRPEGKKILDFLCSALSGLSDDIAQIRIMGHTNQADPNKRNTPRTDWFLSSQRAAEVCSYIDEKGIIEPKKLTTEGKGQNYPIGSFETAEDRQRNRRVEILIAETEELSITLDELYTELEQQTNLSDTSIDSGEIDLNLNQSSDGMSDETDSSQADSNVDMENASSDIPQEDMIPLDDNSTE